MINEKLIDAIEQSGIKKSKIAEFMGISRHTLYNKINGNTKFTDSEIVAIAKCLRLTKAQTSSIFFD